MATWSDVKAILDDPSVPPEKKTRLISSWLRENPPPPPFLADQEPDEIKQKRQEADRYAQAFTAHPLLAGQSVDEAYNEAKRSGDQNSYNEDQEKKAVGEGKTRLDETRPPAAGDDGSTTGTKTSDEIFDAAAPALKLFETFGSLLAKIPADCRGNTRALDLDNDIRKPFDEQRGISFADFVADAAHFKRGAETVDRTVQDTGAQLGTLYRTWSGAGADAASDTYNDKIQPKAAKLSQTLGQASEATLATATTVFQLCKGKADAVIGMYTDLVGKADYTMAQKVVAVANGEKGNEEDLAQIAGWMDLNFGTNLVQTLNDQGCCDGDEIKKHGQDLAKQWVQNQFNPDMWDRLYQGFVKTCKDTKDLVDQAYTALGKVMGGIRNEFEGVSLPGGSGSGSGTAGGAGGGPGGSSGGGSGAGSGSGSGGGGSVPPVPEVSTPSGAGPVPTGPGAGSDGSSAGAGAGGGGAVPPVPELSTPSGASSGSGGGAGGPVPSIPGAGGGSVPPVPELSTPSGPAPDGTTPSSVPPPSDDGGQAAAEEAKRKAAEALKEFSGPGISTVSGADAGGLGGGDSGDPAVPDSLLSDDKGPDDKDTDDDRDVLKVKQGDRTFEMTEPDHDGRMDIKVGDGHGDPKDFKLDWSADDPQRTDDAHHPGPDGKIHIEDGDLKITAERPDGPDGPTVVTVDDGSGTPTTYTLGEDDKLSDALGDTPEKKPDNDLPAHRGILEDLKPHNESGESGTGSESGGGSAGSAGGDGSAGSETSAGGRGGESSAGSEGGGDSAGSESGAGRESSAGSESGAGSAGGVGSAGSAGSEGGGDSAGGGGTPGGGTPTPLHAGTGTGPTHATLGETPVAEGVHTGIGAAQPQPTATAFAPAAASAGSPSSAMSGMPAMGAMGGQGAQGGDTERRSPAYRIEGAVFDNLGEPGRRIIGSLDDDEDRIR
ncbi:WXG100 family type VII secretion target [Amycolatopsis sp. NEAU-NG30]|uniref:WXG100 family type VII secretion target n=1 Tax=Amycolatopsis melonis TaxID=3156488 RepID=A0ABV0LD88_9PSEU